MNNLHLVLIAFVLLFDANACLGTNLLADRVEREKSLKSIELACETILGSVSYGDRVAGSEAQSDAVCYKSVDDYIEWIVDCYLESHKDVDCVFSSPLKNANSGGTTGSCSQCNMV